MRFIREALMIVRTALLFLTCGAGAGAPNVVLVMADDLGWGDTAYNGHPHVQTPHLDQMARDGVRFDRFYSASPVCSPTRASCLTGRHPQRMGIGGANSGKLPEQERTLPEYLQSRGYATGHFGKWHLGTLTTRVRDSNRGRPGNDADYATPWSHGYATAFVTEAKVPTWNPMLVPSAGYRAGAGSKGKQPGDPFGTRYWESVEEAAEENLEGDDSRVIMDRVVGFVEGAVAEDRPFFAVVWFHTPHAPTNSGGPWLEPYAEFDSDRQHYWGAISAMDAQVGRLRERLEALGVADQTAVWFTSDNGPEGGPSDPGSAGELRGRKRSLYEGGVRVPGLVVWPGVAKPGAVVTAPCVTSDYFPTIVDALGDDPDDAILSPYDGVSLTPLLRGERRERGEPIYFDYHRARTVVGDRWKLYQREDRGQLELYDLTRDPSEASDLASEHPEVVRRLSDRLAEWRASVERSAAGADY